MFDDPYPGKFKKSEMTSEILKEYFNYDPLTGSLTWKRKHCSKVVKGSEVGSLSTAPKAHHKVVHFKGSLYAVHRLIWCWYYGSWPTGHIDHINHDELDNRIENLRDVSQAENNLNNSLRSDNSTGYTGIWINKQNSKKKYMAEISLKGKKVFCKSFYTLQDAINARQEKLRELGFHPNHGIPKPQ